MAGSDARRTPYYPALLDLRGKRVVVVGGGAVATGKVRGLLPCGPEPLVVVAPDATAAIREHATAGALEWQARAYRDGDLAGADLAFAVTDDRALNARVAAEARRRRILVLAVDDRASCDFIAPALVRRGDLVVAVSTNGRSPAVARYVRERLERLVPTYWAELLEAAAAARVRLAEAGVEVAPERWQAALGEPPLVRLARAGRRAVAIAWLLRYLGPASRA